MPPPQPRSIENPNSLEVDPEDWEHLRTGIIYRQGYVYGCPYFEGRGQRADVDCPSGLTYTMFYPSGPLASWFLHGVSGDADWPPQEKGGMVTSAPPMTPEERAGALTFDVRVPPRKTRRR